MVASIAPDVVVGGVIDRAEAVDEPVGQQRPRGWVLAQGDQQLPNLVVELFWELQVLGGLAVGQQQEQLDRAAQRQVVKSWQHRATSAASGRGATVATRASMELTQLKGPV
jgi:hypothetical protein